MRTTGTRMQSSYDIVQTRQRAKQITVRLDRRAVQAG